MMVRKVESKNMEITTKKAFSNTYRENNVPSSKQPQRLTPQQLDERREKGLFFNCDSKYSNGYNFNKKKLFSIYCEEEEPKEEESSQEEVTLEEIKESTLEELLPPYLVMHWLEIALLKLSRSKDTSKRIR